MDNIQVFENSEFGSLRTIEVDGEPWFVGRDVALTLGYAKPENALSTHVDSDDKTTTLIQGNGSNYKSKAIIINESGLYSLIIGSKLPSAKKFKHWVTSEVLPSIRKHGAYMTPDTIKKAMQSPDFIIQLATELKAEQEKSRSLQQKIDEDKPKTVFADAVSVAKTSILVGDLAKILRQNGIQVGQNRLFEWMRENGYLMKRGDSYNLPTQYSMERGWFEVKETTITHPDGHISINKTPKVTGRGQLYFVNLFLKEKKDA